MGSSSGELTLGSDNGSALTARRFKARLAEQGIRHRRGGYRDPESQAFIESWFGKPKERELWLNDYETLDQARRGIAGYVARYHHLRAPTATPSRRRTNAQTIGARLPDAPRGAPEPGRSTTTTKQQQLQKQAAQPVNTDREQTAGLCRAKDAGFYQVTGQSSEATVGDRSDSRQDRSRQHGCGSSHRRFALSTAHRTERSRNDATQRG